MELECADQREKSFGSTRKILTNEIIRFDEKNTDQRNNSVQREKTPTNEKKKDQRPKKNNQWK